MKQILKHILILALRQVLLGLPAKITILISMPVHSPKPEV